MNNDKSLEKQTADLGAYLKAKTTSAELRNMMTTLLTYYSQYQNSYVKHNDSVNEVEINFVVEITSIVPSPFRLSIIFSTLPTKENKFMYVPILRKLNDAVRQIKSADPDSVISRYFIECLIDKKVLHPIMYGDSWMINLDALFFYLQGIAPPSLTAHQQQSIFSDTSRIATSGDIWRAFLAQDQDTPIRKLNIRYFIANNNLPYFISPDKKWQIDYPAFLQQLNPRNICKHSSLPRIRNHDYIVDNFTKTHPQLCVTRDMVEFAILSDKVFKTNHGRRWLINYDQLERQVLADLSSD